MLCVVAAIAGADTTTFQLYNKTRNMFVGRPSRSAIWERGSLPIDRHQSYSEYDASEEGSVKAVREERDITVVFRPLCQVNKVRREFKEVGYEFRPPYYDEVTCKTSSLGFGQSPKPNQCGNPFSCVQRKREIFLTRRSFVDGCWETVSMVVPSNCECMWPESHFGDIE